MFFNLLYRPVSGQKESEMSEFNIFTRDELISEVEALRLKLRKKVIDETLEATGKERESLKELTNRLLTRTARSLRFYREELLIELHEAEDIWRKDRSGLYTLNPPMNIHEAIRVVRGFLEKAQAYEKEKNAVTDTDAKDVRKSFIEKAVDKIFGEKT